VHLYSASTGDGITTIPERSFGDGREEFGHKSILPKGISGIGGTATTESINTEQGELPSGPGRSSIIIYFEHLQKDSAISSLHKKRK
jgi:hypothetical protein